MVSAAMGKKLDLSGLTDHEAEHVLQVVQRDMRLRQKEEERLSELRQELDDEGSRCLLLSRQSCFNVRCCIRCCSPFTFLLNPKRQCRDCRYNVCKACCIYNKRDKAWLCSACQKSRLLKTQSLEWFYTNVKSRFKRFGSAKVLKTLYRKHLAEHSALSELTEGSGCEESICNEGSVCGSDSTFYRQAEEHSVADTLTVAMRVAEEAIDEAISKAEFDSSTQDNEALYLRQHREELIEELAKTIVKKIVSRRKIMAEMTADYDPDRILERITDPYHHQQPAFDQVPGKQHSNLWRSRSAFSLLDNEPLSLIQDAQQVLKESTGPGMTAWLSADCLDNIGVSSVLKSPDGNWIALQSASLSRPSLLTAKRGQVLNTLEQESEVRSAHEGLDSDKESQPEPDGTWGAVLHEIHRKLTDSNLNLCTAGDHVSDSEGNWKPNKPLMAALKLKVPAEIRKPSSSRRTSIIDVNFNLEGAGEDKREDAAEPEEEKIRSEKKRRGRTERAAPLSPPLDSRSEDFHFWHPAVTQTSRATTPEPLDSEDEADDTEDEAGHMDEPLGVRNSLEELSVRSFTKEEDLSVPSSASDDGEDGKDGRRRGSTERDKVEEKLCSMETDVDGGQTEDEGENELDEEMRERLYKLVTQSRLAYFSSTDDELNKECEDEPDGDEKVEEEDNVGLTYKLCQLEEQVRASQFSSTEDELDRVGVEEEEEEEEEEEGEEEEDEHDIELAVRVCRLAYQANATQFSSTEDELDKAGQGDDEEEAIDEGPLWKLQPEKVMHAAQLRELASLLSASQFSSTEDELDRVDEGMAEMVREEGAAESSVDVGQLWEEASERRESIGDIDVNMFDLRDESEGAQNESSDEDDGQGIQVKDSLEGDITREEHNCDQKVDTLKPEQDHRQEVEQEVRHEKHDVMCIRGAESEDEGTEFDGIMSSMLMMDSGGNGRMEQEEALSHLDDQMGSQANCEVSVKDTVPESASRMQPADCGSKETLSVTNKERNEDVQEKQPTCSSLTERCLTNQEEEACEVEDQSERGEITAEIKDDTKHYEGIATNERGEHITSAENMEQSSTLSLKQHIPSPQEIQNRYSAVALCSITTEVLKMLNATEELLQDVDRGNDPQPSTSSLPPGVDPKKLDQQFSKLEEHVYVAAGSVYNLEEELCDLEEYARSIHTSTPDLELCFLEDQVAAAAAKVQQSEMKVSDISARIAALKNAGLNVAPQPRVNKNKNSPVMASTLDAPKQMRRRLPAPPVKEDKDT
ncbi:rab effector MyRIP isoform X2 [Gouania willdenowi]|uniref:rab effector MyRIP isoform X2 n=1 Tax=Gouania willdenowi TaxID=441366 RepID=UPI001056048E|nr:rab effector MyRIP-like isoform X2 [Gouania willdenowi]